MQKVFSFSIIFVFLLTVVSPAFAVTRPSIERTNPSSKAAEKKQERQDASMEKLKERADKEISRRIESLRKLITRISEFKKISSAQKTSLTAQVQAEIDKLTALQAKIAADTDLETLKTDVKSIVTAYRIYALFMPKIQILGSADRLQTTVDQMSSHAARLETKIGEQESNGQDVSELQTLLTDMKANIASAKTQAQNAIDTVTPLTPEGYPDNKTELQEAREMVVTSIKYLNTARQDGRKIIVGLLKLGKATTSTVTTTP